MRVFKRRGVFFVSLLFIAAVFILIHDKGAERVEDVVEEADAESTERRIYGVLDEGYTIEDATIKQGETMESILSRHNVPYKNIFALERAADSVFSLNSIRGGNKYTTLSRVDSLSEKPTLEYLAYNINNREYVLFSLRPDSIYASRVVKPVRVERHKRTATITSSLWGAIMEAGLPYALGAEIEDIYQWSVDFFSVKSGDSFTVIYDERFVDDTVSIGLGRIWGAKFTHANHDYFAIPFKQGDKMQYWEADGGSLRKQMLKAPLKYSRISSGFSYSRFLPVHKVYKPHTGVDYAAPLGTPVHSVADGVVIFKGWGGGGGNTLKIKHAGGFTTGYLHLKSYAKGIYNGVRVTQGQTIGYVGSTGTSTGPHLDYRIWKGSVPINPLKLPSEPSEPITAENHGAFEFIRQRVITELDDVAVAEKYRIFDLDLLTQCNDNVQIEN